jgi:hypothetical protein
MEEFIYNCRINPEGKLPSGFYRTEKRGTNGNEHRITHFLGEEVPRIDSKTEFRKSDYPLSTQWVI